MGAGQFYCPIVGQNYCPLTHEMIPANRGVNGRAFSQGKIREDNEAIEEALRMAERIIELGAFLMPK